MEENVLVSIIVTTYNRKELLDETLHSIMSQTYQNFELIVVDNYSDYDFVGYINSFDSSKIHAYQNKNDGIVAINRNFGIEKARGEYIAFCDDDDLWEPDKLEKQVNYMNIHSDVDIIGSALTLFGEGVEKETYFFAKYTNVFEQYSKNFVTPSTVLLRNTVDVRFFENSDFNCAEDWALWMKLYIIGFRLYQMPEPLVKYRITSQNLTRKNKANIYLRGSKILRYLKRTYRDKFDNKYFIYGMVYQYINYVCGEIKYLIYLLYKITIKPFLKVME